MNHTDLKILLDNIESDSMSRDEVFYDSGEGVKDRKRMFFKYVKELKRYFEFYLEYEEKIMNDEDEEGDEFSTIVKGVNDTYRNIVNN